MPGLLTILNTGPFGIPLDQPTRFFQECWSFPFEMLGGSRSRFEITQCTTVLFHRGTEVPTSLFVQPVGQRPISGSSEIDPVADYLDTPG